jgi:hypothetical protein
MVDAQQQGIPLTSQWEQEKNTHAYRHSGQERERERKRQGERERERARERAKGYGKREAEAAQPATGGHLSRGVRGAYEVRSAKKKKNAER